MSINSLSFRIDEELLHKLHVVADYEGRSANSQLTILVCQCIEQYEEKHGEIKLSHSTKDKKQHLNSHPIGRLF